MTTRDKIIEAAITLFNRDGFGKVSLQAIADKTSISQGNLTYHFRTKQDLVRGILVHISHIKDQRNEESLKLIQVLDIIAIFRIYIQSLQDFRFFYRDIYEISSIAPEVLDIYKKQIAQFNTFCKNGIYMAIGKGIIIPEPHAGHYDHFINNSWAIMHAWIAKREILGPLEVPISDALGAMLELHYLNLTETGKELYYNAKARIGDLETKMEEKV